MMAARHCNDFIVEELAMDPRIALDEKNVDGSTALMYAVEEGCKDVVGLLLGNRADPNIENHHNTTALTLAIQGGDREIVQILLRYGASVNMHVQNGWTPLLVAIQEGNIGMIDDLISKGADIRAKKSDGLDAMTLAEQIGNEEVLDLLSQVEIAKRQQNKSLNPQAVPNSKNSIEQTHDVEIGRDQPPVPQVKDAGTIQELSNQSFSKRKTFPSENLRICDRCGSEISRDSFTCEKCGYTDWGLLFFMIVLDVVLIGFALWLTPTPDGGPVFWLLTIVKWAAGFFGVIFSLSTIIAFLRMISEKSRRK